MEFPFDDFSPGDNLARPHRWNPRVVRLANAVYDVAPDGQSFFVVQRDSAPKELRIVFNWFEELDRLAGN